MPVRTVRHAVEVVHVVIDTSKPCTLVRATLAALTRDRPEIPVLLADGITDRFKQQLEAAPELSIFLIRDHGVLLGIYARAERDAIRNRQSLHCVENDAP